MFVIDARNVNEALEKGIDLIKTKGQEFNSRNGPVLELDAPVTTIYRNPFEKVLFNRVRDANPFFHLMESLWILAGRKDVKFLTEFNGRMGEYSDDGMVFNAPYGYRMREGINFRQDQIANVIDVLTKDPLSRQAVIQIWDDKDLTKTTKDKACNMSVVFSVRRNMVNMTVFNRSNDMLWGAYGANAVQFAMLQEYVAGHLGCAIGTYTQVSNNMHVYTTGVAGNLLQRIIDKPDYFDHYSTFDPEEVELIGYSRMSHFDQDLARLFNLYDRSGLYRVTIEEDWKSDYFKKVVIPMLIVWVDRKLAKDKKIATLHAIEFAKTIISADWRFAAETWLVNRYVKLEGKFK